MPALHIRLIGPRDLVDTVATGLTATIRTALGPDTHVTRQTCTARRTGHVRLYLTATTEGDPTR